MGSRLRAGMALPQVTLARLTSDDLIETIALDQLFRGKRVVVVGVVGAFTPVCTHEHAPEFVRRAGDLHRLGFDLIVCVAPNDPWTLKAWSERLDPHGNVLFLSDGNLELVRQLGVTFEGKDLFVGETSRRYLLILNDLSIERLTVEPTPTLLTCTRAADLERAA